MQTKQLRQSGLAKDAFHRSSTLASRLQEALIVIYCPKCKKTGVRLL